MLLTLGALVAVLVFALGLAAHALLRDRERSAVSHSLTQRPRQQSHSFRVERGLRRAWPTPRESTLVAVPPWAGL